MPALLQAQHTCVHVGMHAHTQGNVWVCVCVLVGVYTCNTVTLRICMVFCVPTAWDRPHPCRSLPSWGLNKCTWLPLQSPLASGTDRGGGCGGACL